MSETVRSGGSGSGAASGGASGTVRCPECGARNEADDDFCGQCGAYLAWESTDAAASAAPPVERAGAAGAEAEVEPEVEPDREADVPDVEFVAAPDATTDAVAAPEPHAEPPVEFVAAPDAPTAAEPAPEPEPEPEPGAITETPEPEASATVTERESEPTPPPAARAPESVTDPVLAPKPVTDPVLAPKSVTDPALAPKPPQHTGPAAMKPVAVAPRPKPRPTVTADRPKPGDLVCPNCGAGNTPGRHFCRRCATPLGATANRRPVSSAQPTAGTRPVVRTRRFRASWVVIPTIVAVLAAIAWLARGPIGDFTQTVLDRVVTSTARNPVELTASTAAAGRGPELAHDGFANLSWAPGAPGPAAGEFLEARFAEPFRLVALQISPGASTDQAEFLAQGRPDDIRVSATTSTGAVVERTVTLADEPGVQRVDLGIDDVVAVRLTIESANGATDATHVAIAEVEFFGR